jgi:uncharacterized membrane protein
LTRIFYERSVVKLRVETAVALMKALSVVAIIALFAIGMPIVAAAPSATFQRLGLLPDSNSAWANGVSSSGTVVVGYGNVGNTSNVQGFSWTGGNMTRLSFEQLNSKAYSTNSDGTVTVGYGWNPSSGIPVVWHSGITTPLPQPGNPNDGNKPCGAVAYGVNAKATGYLNSVIAGQSATPGCGPGIAVAWINGEWTNLFPNPISPCGTNSSGIAYGVSADGSAIVGTVIYCYIVNTTVEVSQAAFVYSTKTGSFRLIESGNGNSSTANAVSGDGLVVVGTTTTAPGSIYNYAVLWQNGGIRVLGPAAVFASALAVNANGSVVVGQSGNGGPAFRWTADSGMQNLQSVLIAHGAGGGLRNWPSLVQATGVSADGTVIVGWGQSPDETAEAWIATLPVSAQ